MSQKCETDGIKAKVLSLSIMGSLVLAGAMAFHTWQYNNERLPGQPQHTPILDYLKK